MAILKILQYPDERLHTIAKPVPAVNDAIRKLAADMAETMYAAPGVGLAATQVDVHQQVIVVLDPTDDAGYVGEVDISLVHHQHAASITKAGDHLIAYQVAQRICIPTAPPKQ